MGSRSEDLINNAQVTPFLGLSPKKSDYQAFKCLLLRALEAGASRESVIRIAWDVAGKCEDPKSVELFGRPEGLLGDQDYGWSPGQPGPHWLQLKVRCRRCRPCLRFRSMVWRSRAEVEMRLSRRTWFGTLTLRPDRHTYYMYQAALAASRSGIDFESEPEHEQFRRRHVEISKEISKFLKRVRKRSGAYLRYLLVAEAHKSGLPHYHLLVHEVTDRPVTKRQLESCWRDGFSKWKLVEADQKNVAGYVAKYLAKSAMARVRASLHYGQTLSDL